MAPQSFREHHKVCLSEALTIAEEMTSDFFKLSTSTWLRARYDILTLEDLVGEEISSHALALLAKYQGCRPGSLLKSASFDFYRICLQDHNILRTMEAAPCIPPLSLFTYILTHELVHVVRFSQFQARFEASAREKQAEEQRVHRLTWEILRPLNFLALPDVVRYDQYFWSGGWQNAHL